MSANESSGLARPATAPVARAGSEARRVVCLRSARELESLSGRWEELLAASDADELFLTREWLSTCCRHLAPDERPALFLAEADGRIEAAVPLALARGGWGGLLPPRLRFLGAGALGADYLDLVARRDAAPAALAALARAVAGERARVELVRVAADSAAVRWAARGELAGWRRIDGPPERCPCLDLEAAGWEELVGRFGASHRANLRRRLRRLERLPGFSFRRIEDPEELGPALDALVDLHRRRWNPRGGSDGLGDPGLVAFHRDFARRALDRGWLRLFLLRLDDRPVAALYGFRYRHRFLFYQSGFDPARAGDGVGLACTALSIRAAFEEGATEYDFLHGEEQYKFLWAHRARELRRIELFPPGARGRAAYGLRRARRALGARLRRGPRRAAPASPAAEARGA